MHHHDTDRDAGHDPTADDSLTPEADAHRVDGSPRLETPNTGAISPAYRGLGY